MSLRYHVYKYLTRFRDHAWVPDPIVSIVDWLRYGWFWPSEMDDLFGI